MQDSVFSLSRSYSSVYMEEDATKNKLIHERMHYIEY
jgi:hypothetical protein